MRSPRGDISKAFDLRSLLVVGAGVYARESGVKPPHSKGRRGDRKLSWQLLAISSL